jgi:hypothetical protein
MDPVRTTEPEPHDPYAYYFARLDGQDVQPQARAPEAGFYRRRSHAFPGWIAVAIWPTDDGQMQGLEIPPTGGAPHAVLDPEELIALFGMCWDNPVAEDVWRAVTERGEAWPDDPPEPKPATNLSADPLEEILYQLRGEEEELGRFLAQPIDSQDKADRAANWSGRLDELEKKADELRRQEKKPHDDAAKRVQERWRPVCELADQLKRKVKSALTPWLAREEKRRAEERQLAMHAGRDVPAAKKGKAGTVGRAVSLTTIKTAVIDDYHALATYLIDQGNVDLRDSLQQIANKLARAGATAPGYHITTVTRAR